MIVTGLDQWGDENRQWSCKWNIGDLVRADEGWYVVASRSGDIAWLIPVHEPEKEGFMQTVRQGGHWPYASPGAYRVHLGYGVGAAIAMFEAALRTAGPTRRQEYTRALANLDQLAAAGVRTASTCPDAVESSPGVWVCPGHSGKAVPDVAR